MFTQAIDIVEIQIINVNHTNELQKRLNSMLFSVDFVALLSQGFKNKSIDSLNVPLHGNL